MAKHKPQEQQAYENIPFTTPAMKYFQKPHFRCAHWNQIAKGSVGWWMEDFKIQMSIIINLEHNILLSQSNGDM